MKNLKRVLSLGLASVMLLGMMVMGASAAETKEFTDASEIQNVEAVTTMAALNVINGKDNGSFDPNGNVTRGEMAKMITIIMNGGVEPVLSSNAANPKFKDIGGHWAQKYIEYCAANGIIAGRGDGTFAPDAPVTGTEAAKMILTSLNYDSEVFTFTGPDWEVNVNSWANGPDAQLYTGLKTLNPSAAINRDNAAQMLFNALEAKVVRITYDIKNDGTTGKSYSFLNTNTLMVEKFNATKVEGVVVANEIVGLGTAAADEGESVIDVKESDINWGNSQNRKIDIAAGTGLETLGRSVTVYVKWNSKNNNYDVIGGIVISEKNVTATDSTGKDLDKINKKLEIKTGNAAPQQYVNYASGTVTPASGTTVTLVDNDNDKVVDYIFAVNYTLGRVSKIDNKNEKITITGISGAQKFEDVIGYDEVEEKDYVLFNKIGSKYYVQEAETIQGELTAYNTDKDDATVTTVLTVDDVDYDVSASTIASALTLTAATAYGGNEGELDEEAIFYLDVTGMIIAVGELEKEAAKYAISWGGATGNKIDTGRIKLTLEDGTTNVYTIGEDSELKLSTSGKGDSWAVENGQPTAGDAVGALVAYRFDEDGKVELEAATASPETTAEFTNGKTLVTAGTDTIQSTTSTVFFYVETNDETGADKAVEKVTVKVGYKEATSVESADGVVAETNNSNKAVAVAFTNAVDPDETAKAKVEDHLYLVDLRSTSTNYVTARAYIAGDDELQTIRLAKKVNSQTVDYATNFVGKISLFSINSKGYYVLEAAEENQDATKSYYFEEGNVAKVTDISIELEGTENHDIQDDQNNDITLELFTNENTLVVDVHDEDDKTAAMGGSIEKGSTVELIRDTDTDEVLMIVIKEVPAEEDEGGDEPEDKPLQGISLSKQAVTLTAATGEGSSDTITITYDPADTTDSKTATITGVENTAKFTVTESNGTITVAAKSDATNADNTTDPVTVTVTVGEKTATFTVTINIA